MYLISIIVQVRQMNNMYNIQKKLHLGPSELMYFHFGKFSKSD